MKFYLFIGTGLYQAMLLIVCGLVNMSCAISTTAVSFIIPAAKDDFNLNSTTKGILNFAPFLGKITVAHNIRYDVDIKIMYELRVSCTFDL